MPLRLGISEGEELMMGKERIDRVVSFTYPHNAISKDGGCSENVKSGIGKAKLVFSQLKQFGKIVR